MLDLMMLILSFAGIPSVEVLSMEPCPISSESWFPLHLGGFDALAFGSEGIAGHAPLQLAARHQPPRGLVDRGRLGRIVHL